MALELSTREKRLLALAEQRGVPVDRAALKRRFNFVVSGITTSSADVAVPFRIGQIITQLAESARSEFELSGIVVFPIIAEPTIYIRQNFLTHKRSSRGYFVGRNIDFELWRRARKPGRIRLSQENFRDSINAIPDRHLSPVSKHKLLEFLQVATTRVARER